MAKLDKQGLNTFIRELDKHINTKINRLDISPTASKVTIEDSENLFEAGNVEEALKEVMAKSKANETSILELEKTDGELSNLQTTNKTNLVAAINEVFQNANNGKETIATAIGSPLLSSDTFSAMGTKIDTLTQTFQNTLTEKGIEVLPSDKMPTLIGKVKGITVESLGGKKWASGNLNVDSTKKIAVLTNLQFTPTVVFCTIPFYKIAYREATNVTLNSLICYSSTNHMKIYSVNGTSGGTYGKAWISDISSTGFTINFDGTDARIYGDLLWYAFE